MTKKNEVQKTEEGGVPAYLADHREDAKENLANIDDAYYRIAISLKSKFLIEGAPIGDPADRGEKFTAIILRDTPVNAYYKTPYDPDNPAPPDCSSLGALKPDTGIEEPVSESCASCPMNKYNTAVDKNGDPAKGKACSNTRRLVLQAPGTDMPAIITLPPTSRKNLDQYLKRLSSKGIPLYAVVTEFSFDDSVEYPKVKLDQVEFIPEAEFTTIRKYRQSEEIEKVVNAFASGEEPVDEPEGGPDKF